MGAQGGLAGNAVAKLYYRLSRNPRLGWGLLAVSAFSVSISLVYFFAVFRQSQVGELWAVSAQTMGLSVGSFAGGLAIILNSKEPPG
jgi:hypothetical protein